MIKNLVEKVSNIFHDKYINIRVDFDKHPAGNLSRKSVDIVWCLSIEDRDEGGNFATFDALKKYVDELDTCYISEQMLIDEGK